MQLNDIVTTKKLHPCGNNRWQVIRLGADVKIKCTKCGRIVTMDLNLFNKAIKK